MVLLSDYVGGLFREFSSNFRHPGYLWWVLIAIVGIGLLVRWNAVRYGLDEKGRRRQARMRLIVYVLRTLAVISLIVAIATPISTISKETEGNPGAHRQERQLGTVRYELHRVPYERTERQDPNDSQEFRLSRGESYR